MKKTLGDTNLMTWVAILITLKLVCGEILARAFSSLGFLSFDRNDNWMIIDLLQVSESHNYNVYYFICGFLCSTITSSL